MIKLDRVLPNGEPGLLSNFISDLEGVKCSGMDLLFLGRKRATITE